MVRKCRYCRAEIPKVRDCLDPFQRAGFCSLDHMADHGKAKAMQQKARAKKKEIKDRKERLKTKSDYAKEAQQAFNAWVRERDADDPCISCGRDHQGQYHAGHYRTVGSSPELRYDPDNCHKQCAPCNNHLSGNIVEYRIRLAQKIGHDALARLEGPHEPARHTIEQLKEIKALYRRKLRELKSNKQPCL